MNPLHLPRADRPPFRWIARCAASLGIAGVLGTAFGRPCALRADPPPTVEASLSLDHKVASLGGELWRELMPINHPIALSAQRPETVRNEPRYSGTPRYGSLILGNGPHARYDLVVDEGPDGSPELRRLYLDRNRNGDLTDDGDGRWRTTSNRGNGVFTGAHPVTLRASWGDAKNEHSAGDFALMFLYLPAAQGGYELQYRGTTARVGELMVPAGKVRVLAMENDGDAVFSKSAESARLAPENTLRLWIDFNGDGMFDWDERFDGRLPFGWAGQAYQAAFSADGATLRLSPTTQPVQALKRQSVRRPGPRLSLLAAGAAAPDFSAVKSDGTTLRLSDLRGKIVILDFWATWCGPCKQAMSHLEELHRNLARQDVVVLGLCVWDKRSAFDTWLNHPQVATSYLLAFDPAGQNSENSNADSIASRLYHVSSIPTFFVIDRTGVISASHVGSGEASRRGLEQSLRALGVTP